MPEHSESSLSFGLLDTSPLSSACWLRTLFGSSLPLKQPQGWLLCGQGRVLPNSLRKRDWGYKLNPASQRALGLTPQAWRCFIIHSCRIPPTWTKSSVLEEKLKKTTGAGSQLLIDNLGTVWRKGGKNCFR